MPECSHTTTVHAPLAATWDFVREMDNWAPLLTGYQGHEKQDDTTSVWRLRGDVGMLSREVQLQVAITQWLEGERVEFTLKGLNEQVDGGGTFSIAAIDADGAPIAGDIPPKGRESGQEATLARTDADGSRPSGGLLARLFAWLARWLFRAQHGEEKALEAAVPVDERSQLTFVLRMDAGGPMAPMINAMLQPALLPATEDLAQKIANRVLQLHGEGSEETT